ncbi:MAG: isochorismatase family protein [Alphaproteobacteria bacterium]|nr:isochorismatase family protein [Alphaproteobacteria bacterium]
MRKTLLVVDMEEGAALGRYHGNYLNRRWWERHAQVVENIRSLSEVFDEVVFVTDTRFRKKSHMRIVTPLRSLAQKSRQYLKRQDDGATVLADKLDPANEVMIVGMNTDACILRTARGLLQHGFNVLVVGDACWTAYAAKSTQPHHRALNRIRNMGIGVSNTQKLCASMRA